MTTNRPGSMPVRAAAFARPDEADLVDQLRRDGDAAAGHEGDFQQLRGGHSDVCLGHQPEAHQNPLERSPHFGLRRQGVLQIAGLEFPDVDEVGHRLPDHHPREGRNKARTETQARARLATAPAADVQRQQLEAAGRRPVQRRKQKRQNFLTFTNSMCCRSLPIARTLVWISTTKSSKHAAKNTMRW